MTVWDTVREVEEERRRQQAGSDHDTTGWLTSLVAGVALLASSMPTSTSVDAANPRKGISPFLGDAKDTVRVTRTRQDPALLRRVDSLEERLDDARERPERDEQRLREASYRTPRTSPRYGDERIPILMYHKIGRPEDRYTVSPGRLEHQLERLYENDFHCVSINDYIEADFRDVPQGKKPVVLTFDDAAPSQFQYDRGGEPSDDSAVGILDDVSDRHGGFCEHATFYVSYAGDDHRFRHPFGGREDEKLAYLADNGYTVGYHTPFHSDNETASPHDIDKQTTILHALIRDNDVEPTRRHYAHPFGATPEDQRASAALQAKYTSIVEAWGGFAPHPRSPSFDPHSIPRVETNAETFDIVLRRDAYVKGEARNP